MNPVVSPPLANSLKGSTYVSCSKSFNDERLTSGPPKQLFTAVLFFQDQPSGIDVQLTPAVVQTAAVVPADPWHSHLYLGAVGFCPRFTADPDVHWYLVVLHAPFTTGADLFAEHESSSDVESVSEP